MKNFILTIALAACVAAHADEAKYVDPNPFAEYGPATQSTDQNPLAANWSKAHDAEIAAATTEDVLAACVADAASAAALLAKVRPAYETDPLTLTQIAAVTQWVMRDDPWYCLFWDGPRAAGRKVWTAALARKIAESKDDYVRIFCRQQLDLCK